MELFFLALLFILMIWALTSGFPVAFALPGSAIITIGLAAVTGHYFAGDPSAYFAEGGPSQWLSAGVTNFRSLYWIVERDTLIAIPLFIFMGIMLQRSKIAEDLLIAMAQLFGPLPGGLGISVVFVGALLAATTGIVGATVIAMGLISLPAMLRNNYSKSLAAGTICASGTLGQIIPPSIVLIILADQLSNAADQANGMRKELYKQATGEFSMPSEFDVVSASAGDMFMGALIPGMILVGLYMAYIFIFAWLKPEVAPPVPYEGEYDRSFIINVLLALVPPLTLIFVVLGSIILGVATVNQAGAIGAIGAMIMAGYRLHEGSRKTMYIPACLAILAIIVIGVLKSKYNLNIKSIQSEEQWFGIQLALGAVAVLVFAIAWSALRAIKINDTLKYVMIDTAKMTSMVFVILIGAAMLTSAFRGFGGEELVKHFLQSLPGGFWTQFLVVMLVIFLLGFFLDFIEIAVVVVPIVAPILLANPEANVTAVWFGVMIGLNIQTSFLTPPFGFALFYLRGVADKIVKTTDIYKGAVAFISLQLLGLLIVGLFPSLVNYVPNRTHLLSETAPPPLNPKLQHCLEDYVFDQYEENGDTIKASIEKAATIDVSSLPKKLQTQFKESTDNALKGLTQTQAIIDAKNELDAFSVAYKPIQQKFSAIKSNMIKLDKKAENLQDKLDDFESEASDGYAAIKANLDELTTERTKLTESTPANWDVENAKYKVLADDLKKARRSYLNSVDSSYEEFNDIRKVIASAPALATLKEPLESLEKMITDSNDKDELVTKLKEVESLFSKVDSSSKIKSKVTKARRSFRKVKDDVAFNEAKNKAIAFSAEAIEIYEKEVVWRTKANTELQAEFDTYNSAITKTIGLRLQSRFTDPQAKEMAACLSHHRDLSLSF